MGRTARLQAVGAASAWLALAAAPSVRASCASPANAIESENCLPGTPDSVWDPQAADPSIEGFAAQASVNPGSTLTFKINTNAAAYSISIYRMGYYGGDGARLVTTITPSVSLPQTQPACLTDASTGLIDCGNWAVSASWAVPPTATSGIYFAELLRPDTGATNIFSFVVRNDSSHSAIVYQAEDTTQQAYNNWGGNSLYVGNPAGRAYKVSFNRPPDNEGTLWDMFEFETSMIRWLEMNSYDMSYISGVDADRNGALLLNHKVFLSVGHDEYWSGTQRANLEAAIAGGVNAAFFSGNTMFWKTRWENSIDGSNTDHRTLVCYKETTAGARIDPQDPPTSTGLWADPMFGPPLSDGGRSESLDLAAAGDVYGPGNRDDAMNVPAAYGKDRFWRNTSLAGMAPGTTTSYPQMLGYEWDEYVANQGFPSGFIMMSSTTLDVPDHLGTNTSQVYAAGSAAHHLILYRAPSGALVFDAGTMQWGWYLDDNHWIDVDPVVTPDPNIQQATVNLFADMGVQPATLQAGLVPATKSTDALAPASLVLTPPQTFAKGSLATVSGTAVDFGGGVVGGVEVSTNNGGNWYPAQGMSSWSYSWTPAAAGAVTALSRATDDSGNVEGRTAGNPVPALAVISPSSAAVGSAGFSLSLTGAGFISGSTVLWNGASRATVFLSSTQLTAAILASDLASGTTSSVTVGNPSPGGGVSTAAAFLVVNPSPLLTALSLSSAAAGSPGFSLGVTGSNFVSSSTVLWNGLKRATVFVSSTQLTAAILTGDLTAPTTAGLTVMNPGPGGGFSAAATFTVDNPAPSLLSVAPSTASAGGAGFSLGVIGSKFVSGSTVLWNGVNRATVYVSSTQLTAAINAADLAVATTAAVTVFNPAPGGGTSSAVAFIVGNPGPVVASLSPSSAAAGGAGFSLRVAGSNFVSGSTVLWNGASRATVFVSSTQLTAAILTTDLTAATTAGVAVTNPGPGGGTSLPAAFVVGNPFPSLIGVAPSSAAAGGPGFSLGVTGSNFVSSSTVLWNGLKRATVFVSSTQLTAAILAGDLAAPTTANVAVYSPLGGTSTAVAFLVYAPSPAVTALAPASAAAGAPGFNLSVTGSNFFNGSAVLWNGLSRTTVFVSSTQLTAAILSGDLAVPGLDNVAVFNPGPGGGTSTAAVFTVSASGPPPPSQSLFYEPFNYANGLITNEFAHWNPTSTSAVISSTWDMTSGSLFAQNGQGWTGVPDDAAPNAGSTNGTDSAIFRLTTKRRTFGDVSVLMTLNQSTYVTTANTPSASDDGVNIALRLTSSTSYYYVSASRRDNTVVIKKIIGTTETTLASAAHTLALGSPQLIEADVHNSTGGAVNLSLEINGTQFLSFVDTGTAGAPLISSGAVGVSGDNAQFLFGAFTVNPYAGGASQNPVPSLSALSPSSATTGSPGFNLALSGSNFISSSTVRWNGISLVTVFVSSAQLLAAVPASDLASSTGAAVSVSNPAPGGGVSAPQIFSVYVPNPIPTLASVSPSSATAGTTGLTISVLGAGFVSSATVHWNGASRATVFVSSVQLNAQLTSGDVAASTTAAVTVFNPAPGGGASAPLTFLVTPPLPGIPTLASISPSTASAGALGFTLNAFGGGFVSSSTVLWNGSSRSTVFVSTGQLSAQILTADLASAATAAVTVFTPSPGGGTSTAKTFLVSLPNPVPGLASISPSSATAGTPGLTLSVFGSGFVSSSTVLWNGASRAAVFVSSVQLSAQLTSADLAVSTSAAVTVFSPGPGGGTSAARSFLVTPPPPGTPALVSISPSSAAAGGAGFALTAFGGGFVGSSTVLWNGASRATVFVSSGQLSAQILTSDLAAPATAAVTVFTPSPGGGASAAQTFLVYLPNPVPTLASIAPSSAAAGGAGFTLNVTGAGFVGGSTVFWNGASRATVFVSSAQLNAAILTSDLAAPATAQVAVFSPGPGGGTSTEAPFVVNPSSAPSSSTALFVESFNDHNGLITNEFAHWNPASTSAVISSTWDMTSGSLFAENGEGWSGAPDDVSPNAGSTNGTDSAVFRLTTKRANFGDVSVTMSLNQQSFITTANTPSSNDDGVNVALRLTSPTSYYYLSASRRDNTVCIKKTSGSTDTTLVSAAHVATLGSAQQIEADVHNSTGGAVTLSLEINGVQILSVVDSGTGGLPLTSSGAVGLSGDNANFYFGSFTVAPFGSAGVLGLERPSTSAASAFAADLSGVWVYPNPWRADLHSAYPVMIKNATPGAEMRIFTISGRWVRTIAMAGDGTGSWDLNNSAGGRVASGTYIYLFTDGAGHRSRGVLAVIE